MSSETLHFPEAVRGHAAERPEEVLPSESQRSQQQPDAPSCQLDFNDESLLIEVSNGSKEALGALFRRYQGAVLSVAKRILRDDSEAEDLCQEVFLLLIQRANHFDPKRGSASSWIIQIAYHRAMNRRQYLTHRQHYQSPEIDAEHVGTTVLYRLTELRQRRFLNASAIS